MKTWIANFADRGQAKLVRRRCFHSTFFRMYMLALIAGGVSMFAAAATGCADFWVQKPRGDGTPIVRAADFGFSATNDFNAAAINRALAHCRGPARIRWSWTKAPTTASTRRTASSSRT